MKNGIEVFIGIWLAAGMGFLVGLHFGSAYDAWCSKKAKQTVAWIGRKVFRVDDSTEAE